MSQNKQPDLFHKDIQPDLLEVQPAVGYRPEPDEVRRDLHRMLAGDRKALQDHLSADEQMVAG